jgi:hypothetical protein
MRGKRDGVKGVKQRGEHDQSTLNAFMEIPQWNFSVQLMYTTKKF